MRRPVETMYCIDCGKELPDGASFCDYCGRQVSPGVAPESKSRPEKKQDSETAVKAPPDVPGWVGWAAFGLFIVGLVSFLLPWLVYSLWCYRRGRREGASLAADIEPPLSYFPGRLAGWLLASIFLPIVAWFTAVHVPTLCYQQGVRVGASEGTATKWFTGAPQLAVAAAGATLAVFWIWLPIVAPSLSTETEMQGSSNGTTSFQEATERFSLAGDLQDGRECYAGKAALELADIMADWCRQYPNDLDAGWCSDVEDVRREGHDNWNQTCADATLAWGELGSPPAAVAEACSAVRDNHIPHADMLGHSGLLGRLQAWDREYCRLVP